MNYTTKDPSDLTALVSILVAAIYCGLIVLW